jgi:hypothetical protein
MQTAKILKQFKTTSAEVGAFIETRTGIIPELTRDNLSDLVKICFHSNTAVMDAAIKYAEGCPEARLIGIRSRLYRRIREVQPCH